MNEQLTDDEQVEALKRWWRENGKAILGGIVLGLAIVFGWQGWIGYSEGVAARASANYQAFQQTAASGAFDSAVAQGDRLIGEFGGTLYAAFTALDLARIEYQRENPDAAAARLQWVLDNVEIGPVRQTALLRLARLRVDQGDLDAAGALLAQGAGDFTGELKVLEGDIASARDDAEGAVAAYREALRIGVENTELVRMKIADLGFDPAA